jgi:hypothetical protein
MPKSDAIGLYTKLGTQEKRAVNRLLRALTSGKMDEKEVAGICRSVSRLSYAAKEDQQPKKKSGYILYYSEMYPSEKAKQPTATLGDIAKTVSKRWKALPDTEREAYNKRARAEYTQTS